MRKKNIKISVVILIFSIIITGIFFLMIFLLESQFSYKIANNTSSYYGVSIINSLQVDELVTNGSINLKPENLSSLTELNDMYRSNMMAILIPLAVGFCVFLSGASFLLWKLLGRIRSNENNQVIQSLDYLVTGNTKEMDGSGFIGIYKKIEGKFEDNLNDFKRLNSYLSHEQKNAIALIRTQMEIKEQEEYLTQMDYLTNSIDDVLTLSDNEESNEVVDVLVTCAQVCDMYKEHYPDLTFDFVEDNTYVLGKERWLFRAIANILDNAIKYGEGKPIHVAIEKKYQSIIIKVQDYGVGMDEKQLDCIFQNKYRINELNGDGYGIGLSLVSHVCDLCHGFVWVDSVLSKGSTFYLSFPDAEV